MYEGGHRVPGIVRWPGRIEPGSESDLPIIGSDFFPTALAAAGIQPPQKTYDGVNLLPALDGAPIKRTKPLYWRWGGSVAYREGPWKIVVDESFENPELYNLDSDVAETTDLSPSYQFTGDELYVRAVVSSSVRHPNPTAPGDVERAWTQPARPAP